MKSRLKQRQPILDIPRTILDNFLDTISVLALLAILYCTARYWPDLPATIPTHFGTSGLPDGWGSKNSIFTLPIISLVIFTGLTVLYHYPHIYNYPVKIIEENALVQYRLARSLISGIKASIILLFAYLQWFTVQNAFNRVNGLGGWFTAMSLLLTLAPVIVYFTAAWRNK